MRPLMTIFAVATLMISVVAGCGQHAPNVDSLLARDGERLPEAEQKIDGPQAPAGQQFIAGQQAPVIAQDGGQRLAAADDDVVDQEPKNPLIRGLRQFLDASPVFNDENQVGIIQTLEEADSAITRIKQENREAMRQMNRQVRLRTMNSPNIILIVVDDLGYGDLGCYGQQRIKTPHIDRLAEEGMRFTDFYAGSPVGTVSRWCLLTGLNSARGDTGSTESTILRSENVTLAEVLWRAGYTTGLIGKWGVVAGRDAHSPNEHGFEQWFGQLSGDTHYPEFLWNNETKVRLTANADGKKGLYADDFFTEEALWFLEQNRRGRPFFLQLAYTAPHAELEVPTDAPYTNENWTQPHKNYAAMITRMDRDVGTILDALKQLRIDGNTAVFFTSDNGSHRGIGANFFGSNGPLRGGKGDLHEGGIRVPLVVRWPNGVPAGVVSDHVCANWDLLPTMAAMVSATWQPTQIDGISMLPTLYGQSQTKHELLYWQTHQNGFAQAVRLGKWKAFRPGGTTDVQLYDLQSDPGETTNVAKDHPDVISKISRPAVAANDNE